MRFAQWLKSVIGLPANHPTGKAWPGLNPNQKTNVNGLLKMTKREKIKEILKGFTKVEQIALLESMSKEIRQKNSIRICKKQFKDLRVDDERPDLIEMK